MTNGFSELTTQNIRLHDNGTGSVSKNAGDEDGLAAMSHDKGLSLSSNVDSLLGSQSLFSSDWSLGTMSMSPSDTLGTRLHSSMLRTEPGFMSCVLETEPASSHLPEPGACLHRCSAAIEHLVAARPATNFEEYIRE